MMQGATENEYAVNTVPDGPWKAKKNDAYSPIAHNWVYAEDVAGGLYASNPGEKDDPDHTKWVWEKKPVPILSQADGLLGPGHNSFTVSPDGKEDWIVFHVKSATASDSSRVPYIQRIVWEDDSPVMVRLVSPDTKIAEPSGNRKRDANENF
jgi:GH43 family beta-xylosidase